MEDLIKREVIALRDLMTEAVKEASDSIYDARFGGNAAQLLLWIAECDTLLKHDLDPELCQTAAASTTNGRLRYLLSDPLEVAAPCSGATFRLSRPLVDEIYRIERRQRLREDAREVLLDLADLEDADDPNDTSDPKVVKAMVRFEKDYGVAYPVASSDKMLDSYVDVFEDHQEQTTPACDTWINAIVKVLGDQKKGGM